MSSDPKAAAAARTRARRAVPLSFKHDPDLPITARRDEMLAALGAHQVVIVAGDTGSGKSTQLPQYCLELGRGVDGLIAHTQPRRIAARALAARIAEELSQSIGATVGFRVRFADQVSAATRLVLMTDGLLLAELNADPWLRRYDTVIVDEAHERTLNVDLLLGVLKRLVERRRDLQVIVTSATLDVERMARFFDAPVVAVSGRSHPIEVRYRPPDEVLEEADLPTGVLQAVRELADEPGAIGAGDVLVFLPGEREIADVGELLERELGASTEIVPLYSRLAWDQQSRVFQRGARRRVVLATNVAETSITVPGIRSVVDSGLARVSRYSARSRLQRLPIEPISRASAEQRKGRCGRLGAGVCIRLYAEADFVERDAFTEPEILRTNLAALLLRLAADGLGAAEEFPFVDPPDGRALNDGYRLLQELGALDAERRITRRGRAMARLPLDPRLARALLESRRFHAESELLAIVSGLSVPDVRMAQPAGVPIPAAAKERDAEEAETADAFEDGKSEFSSLSKLWRAYRRAREGPRRELRRWCKERRLSLLRLSEWDNVYAQVKERAAELGIVAGGAPASYTAVHRSLLAGFCSMIGVRGEQGVYLGTRGVRFHIAPGSALKRRKPQWLMAANIVETSRVYARRVAEIQPAWIEAAAEGLLKREYLEPDWSESRAEVVARERTSFLGLVLRADRTVNYGPIAPEESRHIFAREALVFGRLGERPDWLRANDAALAAAQRVEERLRTRDLLVDAETLVEFYDRALPRQVSSAATLENYTRHLGESERSALQLQAERLFVRIPDAGMLAQFPERALLALASDGTSGATAAAAAAAEGDAGDAAGDCIEIDIAYRFAPGEADDGATLLLPLLAVPRLDRRAIDAAVPGFAGPRTEALLRTLPKEARRRLIPIAATAARFAQSAVRAADAVGLAQWLIDVESLPPALVRLDTAAIEPYLTPSLRVLDRGRELCRGRDLVALRRATAARAREQLDRCARGAYRGTWRGFEHAELPWTVRLATGDEPAIDAGIAVFPALARCEEGIEVRYYWSRAEAEHSMQAGSAALARLVLERQARDLGRRITEDAKLLLAASPYLRGDALVDTLLQLTFRRSCFRDAAAPRTRAAFELAVNGGRERLFDTLTERMGQALVWFTAARQLRNLFEDRRAAAVPEIAAESAAHLRRLFAAEALTGGGEPRLTQIPRYLKAVEKRWQRLLARGGEAPAIARELAHWSARAEQLAEALRAEQRWHPELEELGIDLEEYRVSLYAQELKTQRPVSAVRLEQRAARLEAWLSR
jgi:ATP-dependent helicase HrpA